MPSAPTSDSADLKTRRKRKAKKSKKNPAKKAKRARVSKKGDISAITSDGESNPSHSDAESPTDEDGDDSDGSDDCDDESGDIEGEVPALRTRSGRNSGKISMDPSRWKKTQASASAINASTVVSSTTIETTPQADAPRLLDTRDSYPPPLQGDTAHPPSSPRISQLTTASITKTDPSWPEWFRDGYNLLTAKDLGTPFAKALNTYIQMESHTSFQAGSRSAGFAPTNRPTEVAWWVARGRKLQPKIVDTRLFEQHWWKWWKGLQPVWREVAAVDGALNSSHRTRSEGDGGWTTMKKHGRNAFLTVMATLVWWAEGLEDCGQDLGWVAAVEEVAWVLDQVVLRFVSRRGVCIAGADTRRSQSAPAN